MLQDKITLLFCQFVVLVCTSEDNSKLFPNADTLWQEFILKYQKHYTGNEAAERFSIFKANLAIMDTQNVEDSTAIFGINNLSDLSSAEFSSFYLLPKYYPKFAMDKYEPVQHLGDLPINFDWRDEGVVTPVKDQGQCGSCWAFSVTEEIESQWMLKGGHNVVELAPQQIVDCDKIDGGCGGGDTPTAYEYVIKAGGMVAETNYPYKAKGEKCAFNSTSVVAKITGWKYVVKDENETEMQNALYSAGPLSICVDAESWQHYTKGILSGKCGQNLDHCVELVGYGFDSSTYTSFWNIRNSWGASWGEGGYIRVERNKKNLCGVATEVTVAVL